jgi:hypothetical protein
VVNHLGDGQIWAFEIDSLATVSIRGNITDIPLPIRMRVNLFMQTLAKYLWIIILPALCVGDTLGQPQSTKERVVRRAFKKKMESLRRKKDEIYLRRCLDACHDVLYSRLRKSSSHVRQLVRKRENTRWVLVGLILSHLDTMFADHSVISINGVSMEVGEEEDGRIPIAIVGAGSVELPGMIIIEGDEATATIESNSVDTIKGPMSSHEQKVLNALQITKKAIVEVYSNGRIVIVPNNHTRLVFLREHSSIMIGPPFKEYF